MEKKETTISKKRLAYEQIKQLIIENEIPKDAPLVERALVERLGISRTPIREALRDLAADGLVTVVDGKGVYVKRIEFRDVIEIFEIREALERKAIQLFIERMDENALDKLRGYMQAQENAYKEEQHKDFMKADMKIHYHIAEGSKNLRLRDNIISIYDQIRQLAIESKDDAGMREKAIIAHRRILKAVEERDVQAAEAAIVEHIRETMKEHRDKYYLF